MNIKSNKARCKRCGDIIESKKRYDWIDCSCGQVSVAGGLEYIKRGFKTKTANEAFEELSEYKLE